MGSAALLAAGGFGPASAAAVPQAAQTLDFLIENVCLDAGGRVMTGVSPIDGNPKCVSQRDLQPGEMLSYHERESENHRRGSDSFPVATRNLGVVAVHIFDYAGAPPGGALGRYDPVAQVGGGTIAAISGETASYVATQLGKQNLKLFVGGGCQSGQAVTAAALRDSWALAPLAKLEGLAIPRTVSDSPAAILSGASTTASHLLDAGAPCPARISSGTTRWSIRPVSYRATYRDGPLKGRPVRLWTLIAERTGQSGEALDRAVGFERAYFTRELGWTRWEAWKSTGASFRGSRDRASGTADANERVQKAHARIADRQNCALPASASTAGGNDPSAAPVDTHGVPRADLSIVGCIEVTDIIPPQNPAGDPPPLGPGTWYDSITHDRGSAGSALFGR